MPFESFLQRILPLALAGAILAPGEIQAQDSAGTPPPEVAPAPPQQQDHAPPVQQEPAPPTSARPRTLPEQALPAPTRAIPRTTPSAPSADAIIEEVPYADYGEAARQALERIFVAAADSSGPLSPVGPLPPMQATLRGMVWQPPDTISTALDELLAMRRAGVLVVRTPVIEDTLLFRSADVLGMAFYQDLPIANLPARYLLDTLAFAERRLTEMLQLAHNYNSARHFGLANYADTSDPAARPYFENLARLVRERGPGGSQAYYLTRFPNDDRCDHTVDFVLLDAREDSPLRVLEHWRARHETPAGIGAFGAPVRPGKEGGWREVGTLAYQARRLETGLESMLELTDEPTALFIYRWTDAGSRIANLDQRAAIEGFVYGLHGSEPDELPRPAFEVVGGFFTGTQRVFAFDAGHGSPERRTAAGMVFVGWMLLMGMGVVYWLIPRFGALSSKYFVRHDLYREAVQRGYDLNAGLNAVLGLALALAGGVAGASALRALGRTDALSTAVSSWSVEAQTRLNQLLGEPILLVLLIALCYSLWLLFNILWLYILTGKRHRIRAPQALTLVVWSRWAVLLLMVWAMILSAMPSRAATALAPVLILTWMGIELFATGRMLSDFGHVTRVPMQRAMFLGFGAPLAVMAVVLITLLIAGKAELGFLWHLAIRS